MYLFIKVALLDDIMSSNPDIFKSVFKLTLDMAINTERYSFAQNRTKINTH